jgi:hypothetical protein
VNEANCPASPPSEPSSQAIAEAASPAIPAKLIMRAALIEALNIVSSPSVLNGI